MLRPCGAQLSVEADDGACDNLGRTSAQTERKEMPMQPSPELRELTSRIGQAVGDGDVAFLERHISRHADVAFLGTDPDEWWTDLAGLSRALAAQRQAGVTVIPGDPLAYQEGNVGWAVDRMVRFRIGDQEIPFRFSVV